MGSGRAGLHLLPWGPTELDDRLTPIRRERDGAFESTQYPFSSLLTQVKDGRRPPRDPAHEAIGSPPYTDPNG